MFKKTYFDVKRYSKLSLFRTQRYQPEFKSLLIEHFGDKTCFTYPQKMRNSKVFFSACICSRDVDETLRLNSVINVCAVKLRK